MEKSFEFAENVIGFIVNQEIDQEKMDEILTAIKEKIEEITPLSLFLEDQSNEGISFVGFLKTLSFHFSHAKDLEKVAIVTDDKLFQKSMDMKNFLVPAKIKSFSRKDRLEAMNWVME